MKHILNDLTEQEKNAIREQHTGGMKVITENFSKLTNSKLGDSKPFVNEQVKPVAQTGYVRNPRGYTKPTQFVPCSSLGIKSLGSCDSKTKRPVDYCSALGVKTPGYCFTDNKQPVPNS